MSPPPIRNDLDPIGPEHEPDHAASDQTIENSFDETAMQRSGEDQAKQSPEERAEARTPQAPR